jgi:hypothetical protein
MIGRKGLAMPRFVFACAAVLLLSIQPAKAECLTTLPSSPAFVPPAPYDLFHISDDMFWYGTDVLWTTLGTQGVGHLDDKHDGYVTKLVFWRKGFDSREEPQPALIVTARRLDGDSPSVAVAHANAVFVTGNTPAMMTGIRIPTVGCWEVTGHYGGHTLSFIVSVEH